MAKLIKVDTQFKAVNCLIESLSGVNDLNGHNLIFCEEKISLFLERSICAKYEGTFNTDVYSFGNYLRAKKRLNNVLSKEASSMAIRKVLKGIKLNKLKVSTNLSTTLYNLYAQLKSAKVGEKDLLKAINGTSGLLKDKLTDIYSVFCAYEKLLKEGDFIDQSGMLNYLEEVIDSTDYSDTDVYIVGLTSFTAQIRTAVKKLIKKAKSFTAILVEGENRFAFVNESTSGFCGICEELGETLTLSDYDFSENREPVLIRENIFNPLTVKRESFKTERVKSFVADNIYNEIEVVAGKIRENVLSGRYRYKEMSVMVGDAKMYKDAIREIFASFEVPYFLDEKKICSHPLTRLITAYCDLFIYGTGERQIKAFIKNPLFCDNVDTADSFENYLIKYGLFFGRIKEPFSGEDCLEEFEAIRQNVCACIEKFDVLGLLDKLNVKEKLESISNKLDLSRMEEGALSHQIYDCVNMIINQMQMFFDKGSSPKEFKEMFVSGVSALELSILPQYNDAVFVGAPKEIAVSQSKCVFAIGLTSEMPCLQDDVSLLTDDDINRLSDLKVLVEPKIKVVNHRIRENYALSLSSFTEELILSYPKQNGDGRLNYKSEIFNYVERLLSVVPLELPKKYLAKKQSLKNFAMGCRDFINLNETDYDNVYAFYQAEKDLSKKVIDFAGKEVAKQITDNKKAVVGEITSASAIEDYYTCPYKAFLTRGLNIQEREQAQVDPLSVGNILHEILKYFVENIDRVSDKKTSDELFNEVSKRVTEKYRLKKDEVNDYQLEVILSEGRKYCYEVFLQSKNSAFKTDKTDLEVKFGDNCKYPAIKLKNGIKLSGKIDRIDTYKGTDGNGNPKDYYTVFDYKSGKVESIDSGLFYGKKLQLFLYPYVVKEKELAGTYYVPLNCDYDKEEYSFALNGKVLGDLEIAKLQDSSIGEKCGKYIKSRLIKKSNSLSNSLSAEALKGYEKYAIELCNRAVKNMENGVIIASPLTEKDKSPCDYCRFKSVCGSNEETEREMESVSEKEIETVAKDLK